MKRFKHSGTTGDLIYSLALVKHLGGGELYLHLNQIDWVGQHYYGAKPTPFHQGRMTYADFEFLRPLMLAQDYISDFKVLDHTTEITHNLDRFRPLFVGHPGNYVDTYCAAFGITDTQTQEQIRNSTWLTVPNPVSIPQRPIVINRTPRWLPNQPSAQWAAWQQAGLDQQAVFVGLEDEYQQFIDQIGWDIPWVNTESQLELASVIAGCELFIGNQSQALSLAIGLGRPYWCEARNDLPLSRNECYFANRSQGQYF